MYESSGHLSHKIIETTSGNVHHDMGLFDECLAAIDSNDDNVSFQAKYCTVFFNTHKPNEQTSQESELLYSDEKRDLFDYSYTFVKPSVSFCIPSTCGAQDLRSAISHLVRNLSVVPISTEDYCHTRESIKVGNRTFNTGAIITWYTSIIIFIIHLL